MKFVVPVVIMVIVFLFWHIATETRHDSKIVQACVNKGGVVVNSMQGFVCVSREFLIKVEET